MEQFREEHVGEIWKYLDLDTSKELARVDSILCNTLNRIEERQYMWKNKLEVFLNTELPPFHSNDWEDLYRFITLALEGPCKNVLLTRDLVSAQIGRMVLGLNPNDPLDEIDEFEDERDYMDIFFEETFYYTLHTDDARVVRLLFDHFSEDNKDKSLGHALKYGTPQVVKELLALGEILRRSMFDNNTTNDNAYGNEEIFKLMVQTFPEELNRPLTWLPASKPYYEMLVNNPATDRDLELGRISLQLINGDLDLDAFDNIDDVHIKEDMVWLALNYSQFELARQMYYIIHSKVNGIRQYAFNGSVDKISKLVADGKVTLYSQVDFLFSGDAPIEWYVSELVNVTGKLFSERATRFVKQLLPYLQPSDEPEYSIDRFIKISKNLGNYKMHKLLTRYAEMA